MNLSYTGSSCYPSVKHLNHFRFWIVFFALVYLLFVPASTYAVPGCQGTTAGVLYTVSGTQLDGNGNLVAFWYEESGVSNPSSQFCITRTGGTCKVKKTNTTQIYNTTAFNVDYVPIEFCPIDDQIWILFVGVIGGLCYFRIRRPIFFVR